MNNKNLIIIGASGHGKVIAEIASKLDRYSQILFYDDFTFKEKFHGYKMIKKNEIDSYLLKDTEFFVAIGDNEVRFHKLTEIKNANYKLATLIDPNAIVSKSAVIKAGSVIMPGAIINADVVIESGVIVNTGAKIDHESKIEIGSHISPGVVIAGNVNVGSLVWIGANATVINNVIINRNTIIGAGSVVISDVILPGTYVGVPIRKVKEI